MFYFINFLLLSKNNEFLVEIILLLYKKDIEMDEERR